MKESELIAELEAAMAHASDPEDAYTTEELCDMLALGEAAVRRRLRALAKAGRLRHVKVMRPNPLDGVVTPKPAYQILPDEAA